MDFFTTLQLPTEFLDLDTQEGPEKAVFHSASDFVKHERVVNDAAEPF